MLNKKIDFFSALRTLDGTFILITTNNNQQPTTMNSWADDSSSSEEEDFDESFTDVKEIKVPLPILLGFRPTKWRNRGQLRKKSKKWIVGETQENGSTTTRKIQSDEGVMVLVSCSEDMVKGAIEKLGYVSEKVFTKEDNKEERNESHSSSDTVVKILKNGDRGMVVSGYETNVASVLEYLGVTKSIMIELDRQPIAIVTEKKKTPIAALKRRERLRPFGSAREGNQGCTMEGAPESLVDPKDPQGDDENSELKEGLKKMAMKHQERKKGLFSNGLFSQENTGPEIKKYVPPGKTSSASSSLSKLADKWETSSNGSGRSYSSRTIERSKLRIKNISGQTTEEDLRVLIQGLVGLRAISSIYIPTWRETGERKDFAFVEFYERENAMIVLERLDGFGYDHLILKVDWARPRKDMGGGGESREAFRSGYGERLAQDTHQKVSYASNLTY